MQNHKYLSLVIFLVSFSVHGQSDVDSLMAQLNTPNDSLKAELYIQLSSAVVSQDPEKAIFYAENSEEIAKNIGSGVLLAKSINSKGVVYYNLNDLEHSKEMFLKALTIFDSVNYKPGIARTLNNIGWIFKKQSRQEDAINYFNQGLKIAQEIDDTEILPAILNNLGTIYMAQGDYTKALEVCNQSLAINQKWGNKRWEAYNLNNIGLVYLFEKNYDEALDYFNRSKNINLENNFLQEYTRNMFNIGRVKDLQKEYRQADIYLHIADSLIEKNGFKQEKLDYLEYMALINEERGNLDSALMYEKKMNDLNLELNRVAYDEQIARLQTKYEVAQKGKELEASTRIVNQQRFVISGGIAMFFLLLGILFLVLRLYKSKNQWAINVEYLNKEIQEKAEELRSINEEVQGVNNNLEKLVEERTEKIKAQNQKLVRYAFINSHEIRGPLARVLGLIYLISQENKVLNNDASFNLLKEATTELDDVIKNASKLLEDEDIFDEK